MMVVVGNTLYSNKNASVLTIMGMRRASIEMSFDIDMMRFANG